MSAPASEPATTWLDGEATVGVAEGTATKRVLSLLGGDQPYAQSAADLLPAQLDAVDERLAERRSQMPVLDRLAVDAAITRISRLDDVVPLLFPHHVYKSYPASFLAQGRWNRMNAWLELLSTAPVEIDTSQIHDVDEWVAQLEAAGHRVRASSGTSGKASFLNANDGDMEWHRILNVGAFEWQGITADRGRALFMFGAVSGTYRAADAYRVAAEAFAMPGAAYHPGTRPVGLAEVNELGMLRASVAAGTATAAERARVQRDDEARRAALELGLDAMAEALAEHHARHDRILLRGGATQALRLADLARSKGMSDEAWAPGSFVIDAGSSRGKGTAGRDDAQAVRRAFEGCTFVAGPYGMSEMHGGFPDCAAERYHIDAQHLVLVLDDTARRVLNPTAGGRVIGRLGLFDLSLGGRWGGVITSDHVEVDFSPCPCGLAGPTITQSFPRYGHGDPRGDTALADVDEVVRVVDEALAD